MKVIIAGSRTVMDYTILEQAVTASRFPITHVISGAARGADKMGEKWAMIHNLPLTQFPANWSTYGIRAGFVRNEEMSQVADALIAVWDGTSKGTRHMIETMRKKGKPVYVDLVIQP